MGNSKTLSKFERKRSKIEDFRAGTANCQAWPDQPVRHIFQVKDLTPETKLFFEQFLEVTPKNTREANCPKTTCLSGVGLLPRVWFNGCSRFVGCLGDPL